MPNHIKNLRLLNDLLSKKDLDMMEYGAFMHRRHSNITFKIVDATKKKVVFQVVQGKSNAENYADKKRLIEIVHETFDRFFPDTKILAHPVPYRVPDPNQVNQDWIVEQMRGTSTRLKQMADDTGIDYSQLSSAVNGRSLSQPMKALFWYYFKDRRAEVAKRS